MSFLSDSFHLFIRWMKKLVRNPILIFFSLFQPVIFLVRRYCLTERVFERLSIRHSDR